MCAICGFAGTFDPLLLASMSKCLHHRGPDDHGQIVLRGRDCAAGLAHRRLAILDLSADGHQPMTTDCGQCGQGSTEDAAKLWLTYNGEIYNYRELRRDLIASGHRFHSQTDSEVLLHLYAEEGVEMLTKLNGIFAFAIYDGRSQGRRGEVKAGDLFLARDGLGVKPLYYAETEQGFLFASELKALLECSHLSRDLDLVALHYYLTYLWAPAPFTPLKQVRKLPPGDALLIRNARIARYWSFYDIPYGQSRHLGSENDIAAELRERVQIAVERQLVADVPVGAFLSGGLDSSAVVAMMRRAHRDRRLTCYCIGFAGDVDLEGSPPDLPYARKVADHLGVDLRTIEVESDIIKHLERMLYHIDEPQADPAAINTLLIAEQARLDGIPVLLSGAGGDDIFSGYRRHWALKMERLWGWLPHGLRLGIARCARQSSHNGAVVMLRHPTVRRITKVLAHADLSPEERMIAYFYWSGEQVRRSLYTPELGAALNGVDTAETLRQSLRKIPRESDPLNRMLYLETKHFLADHNLNYTDKMAMAAGVEVRVPLLDLELVDFATRIPPTLKQVGRTGKAIFKKAMEPFLPREVIYRPKSGFGVPLRRWLESELREAVEDTLSSDSLKQRGLFEPRSVQRLVEMDRAGLVDGAYTVFSLMCIELWCRMFADKRAPTLIG
ncbi:asparagine synthase (glutamine-hydrolyzing) [Candidatus Bathyarchaeota archaeon]|nr:MAG: asparagine synthase (glutamine-hydrolyzing) [Candidatus Bathyarchaeota archaeon]